MNQLMLTYVGYNLCACGCDGIPKLNNLFILGHNSRLQQSAILPTKKCPHCGNTFHSMSKYCSAICYHNFDKGKPKKKNKIRYGYIPWNKGLTIKTSKKVRQSVEKMICTKKNRKYPPRKRIKLVSFVPWNKGLNIESSIKVRQMGRKISCTIKKKGGVSPEIRAKIRKAVLDKYNNDPEIKRKISIARLRQILPLRDTKPEILLQNGLKNKGIQFLKHYPTKVSQVDIFIPPNILIFVDGCYWHGCKKCKPENYLINKKPIEVRRQRDTEITNYLKVEGFIVLRFWEHDINNNFDNCINKILEKVKQTCMIKL